MTREEVFERLNDVFREVFDDDTIEVDDDTTSEDIDEWDSLMHITLMESVEEEFDIRLSMKTITGAKNVGELVDAILEEI